MMEREAQALREEFAEHGVVAVRGLLGADDLAEARRCYEKVRGDGCPAFWRRSRELSLHGRQRL